MIMLQGQWSHGMKKCSVNQRMAIWVGMEVSKSVSELVNIQNIEADGRYDPLKKCAMN